MGTIAIATEEEWHSVREQHIGGSEIASLFYRWRTPEGQEVIRHLYEQPPADSILLDCVSSFKTGYRLWQEKAGHLKPESFVGNDRVNAGTFLEPALAEWAKTKWDWKLRKVRRYCTHETVQGWGASLDYEIFGGDEHAVPVEFKNVDWVIFQRDWLADQEEILNPPIKYLLQLQHQMGAVGAPHGWIVACVAGNQLMRGRIPAHAPTQERIAQAIESFWNGVRANKPPEFVADYETVSKLNAIGVKGQGVDLTAEDDIPILCSRYLRIKQHHGVVETVLDNIKARIAAKVGENNKAVTKGFKLTWPVVTREEKLIPARTQQALTYRGALTISKGE